MKRVITGIITLALLCCIAVPCFATGEKRTVKVGFPIQSNLTQVNDGGKYSGYTYEYIMKIAQYAGWNIEFVTSNASDENEQIKEMMEWLENGEIDVLGTMLKTDSTVSKYEYPSESYGNVYTTLLTSADNTSSKSDGYLQQASLNIAVLKNAATRNNELDLFCRSSNIAYTAVECENEDEQLQKTLSGECDAMLSVSLRPHAGTKTMAQFSPRPFYFISKKGNSLLASEIDEAIKNINKTSPDFQSNLHNKYFLSKEKTLSLTQNELDYIANKKTIRALVPYSVPPIVAKEKDTAVYYGIFVSFSTYLKEKTGLNIELYYPDEGQSMSDAIAAKNCDIVLGVISSYQYALNRNIIFSEPLLSLNAVMFYNKNININDLTKLTLAQAQSQLKTERAAASINEYHDISECVLAVENGDADYGYGSSLIVDYCINNNGCTNIALIPLLNDATDYSVAFPSYADTTLISIVNKVILTIDEAQINSFTMQTHYNNSTFDLISYIKRNPVVVTIVLCILVLIIISTVFFAVLSHRGKKQNKALRIANDAKDAFMSRMSHELLTPMHSIISNSSFIKNENNIEDIRQYNNSIYTSSKYMLTLINDILELSTKDSEDKAEKPVPVVEIASTLEALFASTLKERNIAFTKMLQAPENIEIICCKKTLLKALSAILSNAVNAAPDGGRIALIIECTGRTETSVQTKFIIRNSGIIDISGNSLPNMPDRFKDEQNENPCEEDAGLGLSVAKKLIEHIGGKTHYTCQQGSGAELTVELQTLYIQPPITQTDNAIDQKHVYDFSGKRILIVDDVPINIEILKKILLNVNAQTDTAANGKIALDKFAASPEGYYDAIVMDIRMPVMDGLEAAEKIRALPRPDAKTMAIIAVSANAFESDIVKSLNAGMNYHISKPIDTKRLYHELNKHINKSANNKTK